MTSFLAKITKAIIRLYTYHYRKKHLSLTRSIKLKQSHYVCPNGYNYNVQCFNGIKVETICHENFLTNTVILHLHGGGCTTPKMKGIERSLSYSVSAGGNVSLDGQAELSSSISTSYTTLEKSPSIKDNGNMLKNYAEVSFTYLMPYDNTGQFYDYNISQSYQSSSFVTKTAKNSGNIVADVNRTVGIVRDAVWSNTLVNFNINSKLTIAR